MVIFSPPVRKDLLIPTRQVVNRALPGWVTDEAEIYHKLSAPRTSLSEDVCPTSSTEGDCGVLDLDTNLLLHFVSP
jgi:hypothetical protein